MTKEKVKQERSGKVRFSQSIRTRIIAVLIIALLAEGLSLSVVTMFNVTDELNTLNRNYMYDITTAYGSIVEEMIDTQGYEIATIYSNLENKLAGVGLEGVESSYAYLVSADGTMLYHPTQDKVGEPVENEVVKGIVEQLKAGKIPQPEVVEYDFKGTTKYAAYFVTPDGKCVLVVSADRDEIMQPVTQLIIISSFCIIFFLFLFGIIGGLVIAGSVKPVIKVTEIVGRLANMDFAEIEGQEKLAARKDETGMMSRAVIELRKQLVMIVTDLKEQSTHLFNASEELSSNAAETASNIEQVEKAVNEISQGATS